MGLTYLGMGVERERSREGETKSILYITAQEPDDGGLHMLYLREVLSFSENSRELLSICSQMVISSNGRPRHQFRQYLGDSVFAIF